MSLAQLLALFQTNPIKTLEQPYHGVFTAPVLSWELWG
jgi:hypothetical protein